MDLQQNKLTRAEWDSIEVPILDQEKQMIGKTKLRVLLLITVNILEFLQMMDQIYGLLMNQT